MSIKHLNLYTMIALTAIAILVVVVTAMPPKNGDENTSQLRNSDYVTFDTVKYVNSRREMTARLIGENETKKQEAISVLTSVEKSTRPTIEKHAKGKIVIVKQALVLDSQLPDITDAVLADLGLPLNTQTINPQDPQAPNKILTPYSTSAEYTKSKESHKNAKNYTKRKAEAFEGAKKEAQDRKRQDSMNTYLP